MSTSPKIGDLGVEAIDEEVENRLFGTVPDATFSVISFLFKGTTLISIEVESILVGISRCYRWSQPLEEVLVDLESAVLREISELHKRLPPEAL